MALVNFISKLSLWGIMLFLFVIFGLDASIKDVWDIAISCNSVLSGFCIYYLASFVIYLIVFMLQYFRKGDDWYEVVLYEFPPFVWMPYKGVDIIKVFRKTAHKDEKGLYILRFVEMIAYWAIVVSSAVVIFKSDNVISKNFELKTTPQKFIILGIVLGIYILFLIVSWLLQKGTRNHWEKIDT